MTSAAPVSEFDDGDPPVAAEPAPLRLLVIDDDATPRMVIVKLAQKLGYATWEASTIAEAAALIATKTFDCMTLDLRMGGRYGTELLEAMSRQQADVPVIVVSSADNDERWEVLRVASLYGIRVTEVPKPLEISKLRAVFEEIRYVA
jgi:two-component system chemotaxis response regulator CheY